MLPCLDRLSLRPAEAIGEFYELPEEEAAELNASGGRDPLTYDQYPANRPRGSDGATFRLFWNESAGLNNPPGHRGEAEAVDAAARRYAVYDAQMLWDWHRTHPRDPYNAMTISREDWMELYRDYGQNGAIPDFVATLPSYTWPEFGPNTKWVKQPAALGDKYTWLAYDEDGALRFKSKWRPTDQPPSNGLYYEGTKDQERKLRLEMTDPMTNDRVIKHYAGSRGHEYVRVAEIPARGAKKYYSPAELLERVEFSDGEVQHYTRYFNGASLIYKNELPSGTVIENALPDRRRPTLLNARRKLSFPNGDVQEFAGGLNQERWVKHTFASGTVYEFQGNKGEEHMVKVRFPSGLTQEYKGNRGEERKVKQTMSYGTVYEFEGNRGEERKVKAHPLNSPRYPNGTVLHYQGPKGSERVAWEETPDGERIERP